MSVDADEFLDITLRPSRLLSWLMAATYSLIGVSLCFANIPLWALGILWLTLYWQAVMQWRRIRTPLPPFDLTRLRWQHGHWLLTLQHQPLSRNTQHRAGDSEDNPDETIAWQLVWLRIIPCFIFLRFKPFNPQKTVNQNKSDRAKPRALLIAKDQLSEKNYRLLLLWLQMRPISALDNSSNR